MRGSESGAESKAGEGESVWKAANAANAEREEEQRGMRKKTKKGGGERRRGARGRIGSKM